MKATNRMRNRVEFTLSAVRKLRGLSVPYPQFRAAVERIAALNGDDKALIDAMEAEVKRWPKQEGAKK